MKSLVNCRAVVTASYVEEHEPLQQPGLITQTAEHPLTCRRDLLFPGAECTEIEVTNRIQCGCTSETKSGIRYFIQLLKAGLHISNKSEMV